MTSYDAIVRQYDDGNGRESTRENPDPVPPNLKLTRVSDVPVRDVRWLWEGRFALGKLSIIAGNPGEGKSLLTCDIAARVSRGKPFADGTRGCPGSAIFICGEDDVADTVRPRLEAADADTTLVEVLDYVSFPGEGDAKPLKRFFSLRDDLPLLEAELRKRPDCRLVVIDPLSAYLAGVDSHKNADVRSVLAPLSELAKDFRVAIIAVEHLNKRQGSSSAYRMQGSIAFSAAARAVWFVVRHPENQNGRLFLPMKSNLAKDLYGMQFEIEERQGSGAPFLAWSEVPVEGNLDDILNQVRSAGGNSGASDLAEAWLREFLSEGPKDATECWSAAKAEGHSTYAVKKAKDRLKVRARKNGNQGGWYWTLPSQIPDDVGDLFEVGDNDPSSPSTPSDPSPDGFSGVGDDVPF